MPIVIMGCICYAWNIVEKYYFHGSRLVVKFGGFYMVLHFILATVPIVWVYWPLLNSFLFTLTFMYWCNKWVIFGENDMSSFD